MARDKESLSNVLLVAVGICLVCAIFVSTSAVVLRPAQAANKELDRKENILRAAGLLPSGQHADERGRDANELFTEFEVRAVDLDTGKYVDDVDVGSYEPLRAARDPSRSRALTSEEDIATIIRRENVSLVYLRNRGGALDKLVLPVRGYGLWGTLYGYLALEGDLTTIAGLGFYDQKETPGLGGEVDNPNWKAQWPGVRLFNPDGRPAVALVKTRAPEGSDAAAYEVDALSGATLTTRGVEDLVNFWTGDLAFGPYLERLRLETAQARTGH